MSLEEDLLEIAHELREENVSNLYVQELIDIAERVGTLEWRLEGLEK